MKLDQQRTGGNTHATDTQQDTYPHAVHDQARKEPPPRQAPPENTGSRLEGLIPEAYAPSAQSFFTAFTQPAAVTTASDVAEVVWRAANDASGQLRFPAGADAVALAPSR